MLPPGVPAPGFDLPDHTGGRVRLEDLRGSWVALWWYPKASTSGWTREGQGFRDRAQSYAEAGAVILGASFDTPEENRQFAELQSFPFRLLSDTDHAVGRLYEVERSSDQPFPDFPNRITYLIDPAGVIREAWTVSDIPAHADAVLAAIASAGAAA